MGGALGYRLAANGALVMGLGFQRAWGLASIYGSRSGGQNQQLFSGRAGAEDGPARYFLLGLWQ